MSQRGIRKPAARHLSGGVRPYSAGGIRRPRRLWRHGRPAGGRRMGASGPKAVRFQHNFQHRRSTLARGMRKGPTKRYNLADYRTVRQSIRRQVCCRVVSTTLARLLNAARNTRHAAHSVIVTGDGPRATGPAPSDCAGAYPYAACPGHTVPRRLAIGRIEPSRMPAHSANPALLADPLEPGPPP